MTTTKLTACALALLLICGAAFAQKAPDAGRKKSREAAESAQALFDENKYPESLTSALQAIQLDGINANAYFWAGIASMATEKTTTRSTILKRPRAQR